MRTTRPYIYFLRLHDSLANTANQPTYQPIANHLPTICQSSANQPANHLSTICQPTCQSSCQSSTTICQPSANHRWRPLSLHDLLSLHHTLSLSKIRIYLKKRREQYEYARRFRRVLLHNFRYILIFLPLLNFLISFVFLPVISAECRRCRRICCCIKRGVNRKGLDIDRRLFEGDISRVGHVEVYIAVLVDVEGHDLIHGIVGKKFVHWLIDVLKPFVNVGHCRLFDNSSSVADFILVRLIAVDRRSFGAVNGAVI